MKGVKFIVRFRHGMQCYSFICISSRYPNNNQFRLSFFTIFGRDAIGHFRVTMEQAEKMASGKLLRPVKNRIAKHFNISTDSAIRLQIV